MTDPIPTFPDPRPWNPEDREPFDTAFRPAVVHHVVDADTIDILADLGHDRRGELFRVRLCGESWLSTNRKIGFNAWETRGAEKALGDAAEDRVNTLCPIGTPVLYRSWRGGSRGSMYRWLGLILVEVCLTDGGKPVAAEFARRDDGGYDHPPVWLSLADLLLHEGHGREWWRGWNRGRPRPTI